MLRLQKIQGCTSEADNGPSSEDPSQATLASVCTRCSGLCGTICDNPREKYAQGKAVFVFVHVFNI